jgi:hypothetical protein
MPDKEDYWERVKRLKEEMARPLPPPDLGDPATWTQAHFQQEVAGLSKRLLEAIGAADAAGPAAISGALAWCLVSSLLHVLTDRGVLPAGEVFRDACLRMRLYADRDEEARAHRDN